MKTLLLVAFTILLGVALGVGTAVLRVRTSPWNPKLDESVETMAAPLSQPSEPTPKAVVDQTEYKFGALDMSASGSHDFIFTNAGDAPLTLASGGTSCRCVMYRLEQEKIPPGGSAKVTVTWQPNEKLGPYQQTVKIRTNDPARPQVTLTVLGRITLEMRFSPPELVFSRLSSGETSTGKSRLFCYLDEPLKILGHQWSDAAMAPYFDVALQPLSAEELKEEPTARSGVLVAVTVKPGLPQGLVHQELLLQTNEASSPTLILPVQGNVSGEITVVGRDWDPDTGILSLGEVSRRAGIERKLILVVRGPLRKEVEFKPVRVAPSVLKVSLGQRTELNNGTVVQIPLTIDIPPDSPPMNHLGSKQGELGEIILETAHPQVPKLRIRVRFAIEG